MKEEEKTRVLNFEFTKKPLNPIFPYPPFFLTSRLKKATVAARGKKAAAEQAAHTAKTGGYGYGYPPGFRNGSPPSLPPGYPPLVYVAVPPKNANQANNNNGHQSPPQYQAFPQTQPSVGQVQTSQASSSSSTCANNVCASSSTNNDTASTTTLQQQQQPQPQQEWTTDDDDTLRRLKAEDLTWKAISTSMGRPVQALKSRWGIIRPAVEYKIQRPHTSAQYEASSRSQQQQQQAETHRRHERRVSFSEPLIMNGKVISYPLPPSPGRRPLPLCMQERYIYIYISPPSKQNTKTNIFPHRPTPPPLPPTHEPRKRKSCTSTRISVSRRSCC